MTWSCTLSTVFFGTRLKIYVFGKNKYATNMIIFKRYQHIVAHKLGPLLASKFSRFSPAAMIILEELQFGHEIIFLWPNCITVLSNTFITNWSKQSMIKKNLPFRSRVTKWRTLLCNTAAEVLPTVLITLSSGGTAESDVTALFSNEIETIGRKYRTFVLLQHLHSCLRHHTYNSEKNWTNYTARNTCLDWIPTAGWWPKL